MKLKEWIENSDKLMKTACFGLFPKEWKYAHMFDYVLQNGRQFKVRKEFPDDIERGPKKQCYTNCFGIVMTYDNYRYCEGYAKSAYGFITEHAWLIDENDEVVDPTWDDGFEYYGYIIDVETLEHVSKKTEYIGIIDNYKAKIMLLKGEINAVGT